MARLNFVPQLNLRWQHQIDDNVVSIKWSGDGETLAAAAVSGPITLFDAKSGEKTHTLPGHGFGTTDLSFHPKKPILASSGQDGRVRLWNTTNGTEIASCPGGATWVEHVLFDPTGDYLLSAAGKQLRLFNPAGELLQEYPAFPSTIADLLWAPKGNIAAIATYGKVSFQTVKDTTPTDEFKWQGSILKLAWSSDANMIAGGGQDSTVHFWYTRTGEDLQMSGYPSKVTSLSWDCTNRFLATNGGERPVVWDCSGDGPAGTTPMMFEYHDELISEVAFQHRSPLLASGCPEGKLGIWFPGGSVNALTKTKIDQGISTLSWSPGDGRIALGGEQGGVYFFTV